MSPRPALPALSFTSEFPATGFPTEPDPLGPVLWDGRRWQHRSWAWLRKHVGGVQRVDVYGAADPEGATLVVRLLDRRVWVTVYADRDVLADVLRGGYALRRAAREHVDAAVRLLEE